MTFIIDICLFDRRKMETLQEYSIYNYNISRLDVNKLNEYKNNLVYLNYIPTKWEQQIRYIYSEKKLDNYILVKATDMYYMYITPYQHPETKYLDVLNHIVHNGVDRQNERTGVGTLSVFSTELKYDLLQDYFPVQDTRNTPRKTIWREVNWYLSGSTDVTELHKWKIHVWDGNTNKEFLEQQNLSYEEYDMGPTYGFQFRHAGAEYKGKSYNYENQGVDQVERLIDGMINNPESRRHIIQLYHVNQLEQMSLPPCLMMYQFYLEKIKDNTYYIDGIFYSRSSDIFLAGYWNICQARIIIDMLTKQVYNKSQNVLIARNLIWKIGDAHIYKHQITQVKELLKLKPRYYYQLDVIDDKVGPLLKQKYTPQSSLTSTMAV
mgnify:CR=1 FL=1